MWTVTKAIDFCAGHRLLNYSGKCSNLHGHNFRAEIHADLRHLNHCGVTIDFNEFAKVKDWVDTHWDHKFIVNEYDDVLTMFFSANHHLGNYCLTLADMRTVHGLSWHTELPTDERIALCNPTVENLSLLLRFTAANLLGLPVEVTLYESPSGWVTTTS